MTLINKINTTDIKIECVKCGSKNIQQPNYDLNYIDWLCLDCNTKQLDYEKSLGFRYYAFLLSGSWTSEYIKARSVKEAFKRAVKKYQDKHEVYQTYLTGGVDSYSLRGWFNF